jgi:hypothetical protein
MTSALASVAAVAARTATGRAPTNATRLSGKRFHANATTSTTFRGRGARGGVRGARLAARAEAITDAIEKDAKAEEVRARLRSSPSPSGPARCTPR